jgi:hypothetical protein
MPADAGNERIFDEIQRISRASVLGDRLGIKVQLAGLRFQNHVFQNRAESDRIPNLRLLLLGQPDALGVAAAFEIKDAAIAPPVLVITNQAAPRVRRERRFAGSRKPEKQGHIPGRTLIGRAMHGKHPLLGQQIV